MSGLTEDGLVVETLETLRSGIDTEWQTEFGASVDVSDESPDGFLIGTVADSLAMLWELLEVIVSSLDPDAATGTRLDAISALTGTLREGELPSTTTLTLTGTPTTVVPADSMAETASTGVQFATDEDATIATLTAWASTTAYVIGDRRTNASRAYVCKQAGTSAGSGGPTSTNASISDGTAEWRYMGEGTGAVDVDATATENGPQVAVSGDITEIVTPVSGWSSVINLLDADLGRNVESDQDLRVRRSDELAEQGASIAEAIRSEMLDVDGVERVTVFMNVTDATDADGLPPHSVEVMVTGGEDQDIIDQLWVSVPVGIVTYGTETGTTVDSQGTTQTLRFTRPEEVEIHVEIDLEIDTDVYSPGGVTDYLASDALVEAAIVAYGDTFETDDDVRAFPLGSVVIPRTVNGATTGVPGVMDVLEVRIDDAPNPATTVTLDIGRRQLAVFDTSRIAVSLFDENGDVWPPP